MAFYPGPGIGGHCLVGNETVVVRSADQRKRLTLFEAIFDELWASPQTSKFEADGAEVIHQPRLEALSLNTETRMPEWKPVSCLFRRLYQGNLVTITTSDNRRVTVTEKHPMLVADAYGRTQQVWAKDIASGDRLPIYCSPAPEESRREGRLADERLDLPPMLPVEVVTGTPVGGSLRKRIRNPIIESRFTNLSRSLQSVGSLITVPVKSVEITKTEQPVYVYSIEVEDTHTFVTSYGIYVHNCIPLDPHYLSWKARMHGFEARFISLAEEVNSRMPDHVVELVTRGLNNHRKPVNGSKVLIMGVAYKRDIDDMRESPALGIIEKLQSLGADVQFHDPYVEEIHLEGNGNQMRGIELSAAAVGDADCVVIVTDHRNIDYAWLAGRAKLVVDTRNTTRGLKDFEDKIIRL
jgi:UDP-glucose 6-dehydrogenase